MDNIQLFDFEFIEKEKEINQIYTFKFKPLKDFKYQAGQWIHIGFPTIQKDKERVRHMSFSSSPNEDHLAFTMDTSSGTLFKNLMLNLQKGDIMKGFKINGNLILNPEIKHKVVFIAGGIGITPIRSLIKDIELNKRNTDWSLLHISRDGFLFNDEFTSHKNNQWYVNRDGIDKVWNEVIGIRDARYFLCGSNHFITGMKKKLINSGTNENQIIVEDFH